MTIRPTTLDDVDGLAALYEGLSQEDRHRRFFSAYHPSRAFLTDWARLAERGGFGLVAVVSEPGQPDRLVADAGYSALPDGDGELAVTVADDARGWLGPYLLDALVEAAAARGVPGLEAEVLLENRPMLALVRARGGVVIDRSGWVTERLLIGTSSRTPSWPGGHDRPRVLVEATGAAWHAEEAARAAGYQVITCPGPHDPRSHCPALADDPRPCPLAADADAVVVALEPGDARRARLVRAHARLHPGTARFVEGADTTAPKAPAPAAPAAGAGGATAVAVAAGGGTMVLPGHASAEQLVALLDEHLGRRRPAGTHHDDEAGPTPGGSDAEHEVTGDRVEEA